MLATALRGWMMRDLANCDRNIRIFNNSKINVPKGSFSSMPEKQNRKEVDRGREFALLRYSY